MKKIELLAPAGNLEKLEIALAYGADAVYFSGKQFGLRAFSDNFTDEQLAEGITIAHASGKKAYITINIFPHNEDLEVLPKYFEFLQECGADAVIISDLGVWRIAREVVPDLPLHISTQANNTNWASVLAWQDMGAHRVVLARELSLGDIRVIRKKTAVELEAFVHGAMCMSYSGRCLLSNYFTGRDANRGECAQPCRWKYFLMEEKRPGQYIPVIEDDRGAYFFNSKDLCMLALIPELVVAGIDSFKIEGRMKSIHYVATVVKVYREAIDIYSADPDNYQVRPEWLEELAKISHRPYSTGFSLGKTNETDQVYGQSSNTQTHDFVGLVLNYNPTTKVAEIEQRNNMKVGEEIEVLQPDGSVFQQFITAMTDSEGNAIAVAPHPQQIIYMNMDRPVERFAMLRRRVQDEN